MVMGDTITDDNKQQMTTTGTTPRQNYAYSDNSSEYAVNNKGKKVDNEEDPTRITRRD